MNEDPRKVEAFERLRAGDVAAARALLDALVRDDLGDAAILEALGAACESEGDVAAAVEAYGSAALHLRARADEERAAALLAAVLRLAPGHPWAASEKAELDDAISADDAIEPPLFRLSATPLRVELDTEEGAAIDDEPTDVEPS